MPRRPVRALLALAMAAGFAFPIWFMASSAFKAEIEDKVDLKGARAAKSKQDEQRSKLAERYDDGGFSQQHHRNVL